MGKKMLALRLRSSLVFFSPPNLFLQLAKNVHLIRTIHNRKTSRNKRNKTQAVGIQAQSSPQKEKIIPVHPLKAVTPLFSPPGSNYLFSSLAGSLFPILRPFCRKAVFGEATGVAVSLPVRVPIVRSLRKKVFPPNSNLCWRASSRRQWFVRLPPREALLSGCFKIRTGRW